MSTQENPLGITQLLPQSAPVSNVTDVLTTEEIVSQDVTVPSSIEPTLEGPWNLKLYSTDCLSCDSLVADAENKGLLKRCHFKNKNPHCPAAGVRIEFVGAKVIALSRVRKAQAKGAQSFLTSMKWLTEQDEDLQAYVLTQLGLVTLPVEVPAVAPADAGTVVITNDI